MPVSFAISPAPRIRTGAPLQVAENLFGQCNRGIADRDGAFAESRFRAHAFADGKRRMKQAIGQRRGELPDRSRLHTPP